MIKIALIADRGLVSEEFKKRSKCLLKKYQAIILSKNFFRKNNFLDKLKNYEIIINCKDSNFSKKLFSSLKKIFWNGYWMDFSSYYRLKKYSLICLNPINKKDIIKNIGVKKVFCGSNCTVSILLIAIGGLLKKYKIKRIFCNTYQSVSGEGYLKTYKLIKSYEKMININGEKSILEHIKKIYFLNKKNKNFLNYSLIPKIGKIKNNKTEEEIKTEKEAKKILNYDLNIHSTCVRVNVLRCHSECLIVKINKDISLKKFKNIIKKFKKYVVYVNNKNLDKKLNPLYVTGKRKIFVGKIKKIKNKTFSIFCVGDQLIWGATEPIYRTLKLIINEIKKKD